MKVKMRSLSANSLSSFVDYKFRNSIAIRSIYADKVDFYKNEKWSILKEAINLDALLEVYTFDSDCLGLFGLDEFKYKFCLFNKNRFCCECIYSDRSIIELLKEEVSHE